METVIFDAVAGNAGLSLPIESELVKIETGRRPLWLVGPVRKWGRVQLPHRHLGHILRHSIGVSDLAKAQIRRVTLRVEVHDALGVFK